MEGTSASLALRPSSQPQSLPLHPPRLLTTALWAMSHRETAVWVSVCRCGRGVRGRQVVAQNE